MEETFLCCFTQLPQTSHIRLSHSCRRLDLYSNDATPPILNHQIDLVLTLGSIMREAEPKISPGSYLHDFRNHKGLQQRSVTRPVQSELLIIVFANRREQAAVEKVYLWRLDQTAEVVR